MKKQFLRYLILMILSIVAIFVSAELTAVIKGKVVNENNHPVEFATATLISPETKQIVKGEVCNEKGEFTISKVSKGKYLLAVSMVGYERFETESLVVDGKQRVIEKTIILNEHTEMLNDFVVVAKRNFIEQSVDKMVIHPDASITSASENVYEILRKLPGVSIDNNDQISLKGMQGVKVLIDDKPTYVSSTQLASILKSMQGKDVERIEIIENPSARYDAEGNSGIINIKTKHTRAPGFNGSFNAGMQIGDKIGWNGGLDLNMNFGKLNLYGNYSNFHWEGWNSLDATRRFTAAEMEGASQIIENKGIYKGSSHNYKFGADYFLAKNHVVSVMMRGNTGSNQNDSQNKTSFTDQFSNVDSMLITVSEGRNRWGNQTYNVNYKWDVDSTGQTLAFDMDYANFNFVSPNTQEGKYYDANHVDLNNNLLVVTTQGNAINIVTSKLDYVLPINKKFNFETGLKTSFVNTDSYIDMDGYLTQHDNFIYEENILAAYVNGRAQLNKTTLQLGLRVENTISKGTSVVTNQVNDTAYIKLFPSFFVQQQLDEKNSLNFRYSYRIGRPSYHHLNPFKWMVDPFTFNLGNPYLKPQFTHSAGFSHNYKSAFITNIGMNYTKGLFTQIIRQDDASRTVYQTMENLNNSLDFNLSETLQLNPYKWWRFNGTITGMYKRIELFDNVSEPLSRYSMIANMNNIFTLPYQVDMEVSGRYSSEQLVSNIIILPSYTINFGLQKKILKNQGVIKVSVSDIFKTSQSKAYAKYDNVDIQVLNKWDTRRVNITFNYRFGKDDFKTRANRSTSSTEEQGRSSK
ncbi:MAG: outer membrane beta-barrel protein [Paludibacter sp.]|nr:outer membrane beta-barrel protein [Paludibacter sp.]